MGNADDSGDAEIQDSLVVIREIEEAVADRRLAEADGLLDRLGTSIPAVDHMEAAEISRLGRLLSDRVFLHQERAWRLVHWLKEFWTILGTDDRRILAVLMDGFDRFDDYLPSMLVAEIVAQRLPAAEAARTLVLLGDQAKRSRHRAMAAYGLGVVMREATGETRENVSKELRRLTLDSSAEVRAEAEAALARNA